MLATQQQLQIVHQAATIVTCAQVWFHLYFFQVYLTLCEANTCNYGDYCSYPEDTTVCNIDSVCYTEGTINPSNLCQSCSLTNRNQWTSKTCDDDGLSCTSDYCESSSGQCLHVLQASYCNIGSVCYSEGTTNPSNEVCDFQISVV